MARDYLFAQLYPPVQSVGVELECGCDYGSWKQLHAVFETHKLPNENLSFQVDSSVYVPLRSNYDANWHTSAEIHWHADRLYTFLKGLKLIWKVLKVRQNETCGNHLHIKFLWYLPFTSHKFYKFFLKRYKEKFCIGENKYLKRLQSKYCRPRLLKDREIIESYIHDDEGSPDRYVFINVLSLKKHPEIQTLEFRIMPYADSYQEHVKQIFFTLNVITTYFKNNFLKPNIFFVYPIEKFERKSLQVVIEEKIEIHLQGVADETILVF